MRAPAKFTAVGVLLQRQCDLVSFFKSTPARKRQCDLVSFFKSTLARKSASLIPRRLEANSRQTSVFVFSLDPGSDSTVR